MTLEIALIAFAAGLCIGSAVLFASLLGLRRQLADREATIAALEQVIGARTSVSEAWRNAVL